MLANPADRNSVQAISYAIVASLLVGVARAWELVGDRDTGIVASIAVLTGHQHSPSDHPDDADQGVTQQG